MFLDVQFGSCNVSALLDTGSSVNLMSLSLFESLSDKNKTHVYSCHDSIVLANNQDVKITCTAKVSACVNGCKQMFDVYVLDNTSHPLILGTAYLKTHGIVLNFDQMCINANASNAVIRCKKRLTFLPNSETIIWGKIPKRFNMGLQGLCTGSTHISHKRLLVARSLAFVSADNMVPLKILNPTSDTITIHKGKPLLQCKIRSRRFISTSMYTK